MAGLCCGVPSTQAWQIIRLEYSASFTVYLIFHWTSVIGIEHIIYTILYMVCGPDLRDLKRFHHHISRIFLLIETMEISSLRAGTK